MCAGLRKRKAVQQDVDSDFEVDGGNHGPTQKSSEPKKVVQGRLV